MKKSPTTHSRKEKGAARGKNKSKSSQIQKKRSKIGFAKRGSVGGLIRLRSHGMYWACMSRKCNRIFFRPSLTRGKKCEGRAHHKPGEVGDSTHRSAGECTTEKKQMSGSKGKLKAPPVIANCNVPPGLHQRGREGKL